MKKLLSILGSLSILSTATITTVISCQAVAPDRTYQGIKSIEKLWDTRSAYTISIGAFYDEDTGNVNIDALKNELILLIQYRFNYEEKDKVETALTESTTTITFKYLGIDYVENDLEILIKNLGEKNGKDNFFTVPLTFTISDGTQTTSELKFNLTNKASFRALYDESTSKYDLSYIPNFNTTNNFIELQAPENTTTNDVLWLNKESSQIIFPKPDTENYNTEVLSTIFSSFIEQIDNENYNNSISTINQQVGINTFKTDWKYNTATTTIENAYNNAKEEWFSGTDTTELQKLSKNITTDGNYSADIKIFGQEIAVKSETGLRSE